MREYKIPVDMDRIWPDVEATLNGQIRAAAIELVKTEGANVPARNELRSLLELRRLVAESRPVITNGYGKP